jgi:hypothetical protein
MNAGGIGLERKPHYEREAQSDNESAIAAIFERRWNCQSFKLSEWAYRLDRAFVRDGRVGAVAEIKNRNLVFGRGDGVEIALHKVVFAKMYRDYGTKTFFIIRCSSGEVGFADFANHVPGLRWSGRTDRGVLGDMEPMLLFPWSSFKVVVVF